MEIAAKVQGFVTSELVQGSAPTAVEGHTQLIETGIIDSMGIMKLLTFLENAFQIKIKDEELVPDNFETINTICKLVERSVTIN